MAIRLFFGYLTLISIAFALIAMAAIFGRSPFIEYFSINGLQRIAPVWVLPPLIWVAILTFRLLARGNDSPLKTIWRAITRHRFWLARGAFFTFLAIPLAKAISAFKASISDHTGYWADPLFANLDWYLFLGNDPWTVTHAIFGSEATLIMDRLYLAWFFAMGALLTWLNFTRDPKLQLRGLLSYILTWAILGMAMAMAFASVGPVYFDQFYGGNRFSELTEIIRSDPNLKVNPIIDFIYETHREEGFGTGISAMPSMHVAIAWLVFLVCRYAGVSRYLTIGSGVFAAVILVASVHLSWHYALDGIVSIAGVSAIWWATGIYVDWLGRADRRMVFRKHQRSGSDQPHTAV